MHPMRSEGKQMIEKLLHKSEEKEANCFKF